jgi:hypothetical protein
MRIEARAMLAGVHLGIAVVVGGAGAHAQTITGSTSIALKNGESAEIGLLYWVINCRSILKSPPEVEILDGPPGVSVAVKVGMVVPRAQKCANPVPGGTLVVTAKDIEDTSYTPLAIRITYRTRDGDRKISPVYNLSLFP